MVFFLPASSRPVPSINLNAVPSNNVLKFLICGCEGGLFQDAALNLFSLDWLLDFCTLINLNCNVTVEILFSRWSKIIKITF